MTAEPMNPGAGVSGPGKFSKREQTISLLPIMVRV